MVSTSVVESRFKALDDEAMFNKFKKELEAQKIFFETLAAVSLSIMAICISVWQGRLSARQTELIERQTRLQVEQALPRFTISEREETNYMVWAKVAGDNGLHWVPTNGSMIKVVNYGAPVFNIAISAIVFLEIELMTNAPNGDQARFVFDFPTEVNYIHTSTSNVTGLVWECQTLEDLKQLKYKLETSSKEKIMLPQPSGLQPRAFMSPSYFSFWRIGYVDILGDSHIEYFGMEHDYGIETATRLSYDEGALVFKKFRQLSRSEEISEHPKPDNLLRLALKMSDERVPSSVTIPHPTLFRGERRPGVDFELNPPKSLDEVMEQQESPERDEGDD